MSQEESGLSAELQATMLAALSAKTDLIPFWRESPATWFAHFETIIEPQHKSDQQKYICVLKQLQEQDLRHVSDILRNPPAAGKYKALKERLISVYEESSVQKYQKLVNGLSLGDQKPTQLLRQMRHLASGILTDSGLKIEWMKQLPSHIRTALSANNDDALDALAAIADRMVDYEAPAGANLSEVSQQIDHKNDVILQRIEALSSEVAALRATHGGTTPGRMTYRPHSFGRARSPHLRQPSRERQSYEQRVSTNCEGICWYHRTFGPRALRCERPCAQYKGKSQGNFNVHQ